MDAPNGVVGDAYHFANVVFCCAHSQASRGVIATAAANGFCLPSQ
jgi:hypothetical protein